MLHNLRSYIADVISPERNQSHKIKVLHIQAREKDIDNEVNDRVATILSKMDPFEPLLRKYNIIFSEEYLHPEDRLDDRSQLQMFMWAWGIESDPSYKYLIDWIRNTQGNATVRKSSTDQQWFFGRAMVASISLFATEVSRLSSRYKDILAERDGQSFDKNLPID